MVRRSAILTLLLFILGIAWDFGPAGADPIPESLRIQREAEKAYQQNRVVPIDRPNAHHRDRLMPENASPPSGNGVGSHGPPQSNNAPPSTVDHDEVAARLKAAYPDFVVGLEGNDVVFKDGTRLPFDDGKAKTFEEWLGDPDIKDMFRFPYPWGAPATPPARNFDPGRVHNADFFTKVYGDCRKPEFEKSLTRIAWLPKKTKQKLVVTTVNGVADKLKAVSADLDLLPPPFDVFLVPSAGAFNCRRVAGTDKLSPHGYGIAVDLALKRAHYWLWDSGGSDATLPYRNDTPPEIVEIFEKHGFIWGGRWFHYDTMHFEYRPELIEPEHPVTGGSLP